MSDVKLRMFLYQKSVWKIRNLWNCSSRIWLQ